MGTRLGLKIKSQISEVNDAIANQSMARRYKLNGRARRCYTRCLSFLEVYVGQNI